MAFEVQWERETAYECEMTKHGVYDTYEEALQSIYDWWGKNKFKPPYIRSWEELGITTIDYGCYSMFYYIVDLDKKNLHDMMARYYDVWGDNTEVAKIVEEYVLSKDYDRESLGNFLRWMESDKYHEV